jgi:hypothetical protein
MSFAPLAQRFLTGVRNDMLTFYRFPDCSVYLLLALEKIQQQVIKPFGLFVVWAVAGVFDDGGFALRQQVFELRQNFFGRKGAVVLSPHQ